MTYEQRQELKPGDLKRACGVHPRTMGEHRSPWFLLPATAKGFIEGHDVH